jgi:hypothetical protein
MQFIATCSFKDLNTRVARRYFLVQAKRVQEHAGPPPEALKKRPATQWVKPGVKLRVKHLRGDHSHIRHASLLGFSDGS